MKRFYHILLTLLAFAMSTIFTLEGTVTYVQAFDLLPYFCPGCVGESYEQRNHVGVECFYTYETTIKGKDGFCIVKSCNDPEAYEEFNYDIQFIYHLADTTWATFQDGQWNNARCYDGREAYSTYLNGAFGEQNGSCEGFNDHMGMEGGIWVPRHMTEGQQYPHWVTVVGIAKEDCQCCQAQYTGPVLRTVKLVSKEWVDLGNNLGTKEVIRICIMGGPGQGENFWYARNYGWIAFGHVDPPDGPKSIFDVNHITGVDYDGNPRQNICPDISPPSFNSKTNGLVLAEDGVTEEDPPANTYRNDNPVQPGETREAEQYWGLKGIDWAGRRSDTCDTSRVYIGGWHGADLSEYLVNFQPNYHTLNVIGLPDDPKPVKVNVYVDATYKGQIKWNDSNPRCNEGEGGNSQRIRIDGVSNGVHAVAFEFANDYCTCSGGWRDDCDRNFWLDYFKLQYDGGSPPPPSGRTDKVHGTIIECGSDQRQANMYVSIWRHDGGQFLTTYTNSNGIYEFRGLDPNQHYNIAVNVVFDPNNCDCCPYRRVDPGRRSAVRNDVEPIDGGDGWHGENFWLCTDCPE